MSLEAEKKVDWSIWHPQISEVHQELIEFCWPCGHLRPDRYQAPLCCAPGSNKMMHHQVVFNFQTCRNAIVEGTPGVMRKGIFEPKQEQP